MRSTSSSPNVIDEQLPYRRTIVIASQRSGSFFLRDLLNGHQNIACESELLLSDDQVPTNLEEYMATVERAYDWVKDRAKVNPDVLCFKIMYNQGILQLGGNLMDRFNDAGIKVIHLLRKNKLHQYISSAKNSANGINSPGEHKAHPKSQTEAQHLRDELALKVEPDKVLQYMRRVALEDAAVSKLADHLSPENYAKVYYEELCEDTFEEMKALFNYLGLEAQEVKAKAVKIHQGKPARTYFSKAYQAPLRKAVEGSEFAWTLDGW